MPRYNLSLKNDEAELADWLSQPGNSQKMKDAAMKMMHGIDEEKSERSRRAVIETILWATIGQDIEEGYVPNRWNIPGEEAFIRIGIEMGDLTNVLKKRVFLLKVRHPAEADDVIQLWIEKYHKTAALAGLIR